MSILNAITAGAGGVALSGDTSGNLTIQSAGTNVATFTSGGLLFTNGSAVASSALNDYEIGTYTVTDASGAGLTFTNNIGGYVKIGQMVYFWFDLNVPVTASGTQAMFSLPFTSATGVANGSQGGGIVNYSNKGSFYAYMYQSNIRLYSTSGGAATPWSTISSSELAMSGFYKANF